MTTPEQAREAAEMYRATGTPVSVTLVFSLADQIESLTKERDDTREAVRLLWADRDALRLANRDLQNWFDALKADHAALMAAGKLALEALEHVQCKNWRTDKAITELLRAGVE